MKKIAADFAIIDKITHAHTLSFHSLRLREYIKKKYGEIPGSPGTDVKTREYAIGKALTHTIISRTTGKSTSTKASKTLRNGTHLLA